MARNLIVNIGSRSGDSALSEPLNSLSGKVETLRPDDPGMLPDLIRDRAAEIDQIILCVGDSTVNPVLNALLEVDRPIGLIPAGKAKDLAHSLNTTTDLGESVDTSTLSR